jgi:O-antigen ligase
MGIIVLLVSLLGAMGWFGRFHKRVFWTLVALLAVMAVALFSFDNMASRRLQVAYDYLFLGQSPAKQEGTESRVIILKSGWSVVSEHPVLGVGTGDVNDALEETYKTHAHRIEATLHLNAHNQYLQSWLATGLPGLFLLVALTLWPVFRRPNWHPWLFPAFLILCAMNFSVESMLETQAGVLFFSFFNSLFLRSRLKED